VADEEPEQKSTAQRVRRRASRAAGPAKAGATPDATVSADADSDAAGTATVTVPKPAPPKQPAKRLGSVKPPPRRQPNRRIVGWVSSAAAVVAIATLATFLVMMVSTQRRADAEQARQQRFVDAATQMVVNMYSYRQDNVDESVDRFVASTSGPLRGMLSRNNAADTIKNLYRKTNATSEAVVTGAALEGIDPVEDNASLLVSVRVTVSSPAGINEPSTPYRLRVIVHEDESGKLTFYDMRYPGGGN
jgi:Mce-associated membrane protein